jgi:hypothetical protein
MVLPSGSRTRSPLLVGVLLRQGLSTWRKCSVQLESAIALDVHAVMLVIIELIELML